MASLLYFDFPPFIFGAIYIHARAAATGALGVAERSYPMSEVRGRSWEDPMTEWRRPRGVTPRRRSGAVAESARLRGRRNSRKELSQSEVRGGGREELPQSEVRGGSQEEQPHVQEVVAAWVQEGLEELFQVQGQEGRR